MFDECPCRCSNKQEERREGGKRLMRNKSRSAETRRNYFGTSHLRHSALRFEIPKRELIVIRICKQWKCDKRGVKHAEKTFFIRRLRLISDNAMTRAILLSHSQPVVMCSRKGENQKHRLRCYFHRVSPSTPSGAFSSPSVKLFNVFPCAVCHFTTILMMSLRDMKPANGNKEDHVHDGGSGEKPFLSQTAGIFIDRKRFSFSLLCINKTVQ